MDEETAIRKLEEQQKKGRARYARWQEKQLKAGKKHISCMISKEAYGFLTRKRKEIDVPIAELIERAIFHYCSAYSTTNKPEPEPKSDPDSMTDEEALAKLDPYLTKRSVLKTESGQTRRGETPVEEPAAEEGPVLDVSTVHRKEIPAQAEPDPQGDDEIPDCHGRILTTEEREDILLKVDRLYPGRTNAQRRADVLNQAGVSKARGGEWVPLGTTDTIGKIKRRRSDALKKKE